MEKAKKFRKSDSEFSKKYDEVIKKIATYNGVDMSVGIEMFKTNLDQSLRGNPAPYKGGGVIPTEQWKEMLEDYKALKEG